jgi:uncharacterized membrane protein YdjX (TVP38/TMEM64 family)
MAHTSLEGRRAPAQSALPGTGESPAVLVRCMVLLHLGFIGASIVAIGIADLIASTYGIWFPMLAIIGGATACFMLWRAAGRLLVRHAFGGDEHAARMPDRRERLLSYPVAR